MTKHTTRDDTPPEPASKRARALVWLTSLTVLTSAVVAGYLGLTGHL